MIFPPVGLPVGSTLQASSKHGQLPLKHKVTTRGLSTTTTAATAAKGSTAKGSTPNGSMAKPGSKPKGVCTGVQGAKGVGTGGPAGGLAGNTAKTAAGGGVVRAGLLAASINELRKQLKELGLNTRGD